MFLVQLSNISLEVVLDAWLNMGRFLNGWTKDYSIAYEMGYVGFSGSKLDCSSNDWVMRWELFIQSGRDRDVGLDAGPNNKPKM